MEKKKLILASASPRRREILESADFEFSVISPECEELKGGMPPADLTVENSRRKAVAALETAEGVIICAAESIVRGV